MCDDDVGVVQGVEQEKRWVDGGGVGTLGAEGSLLDTFITAVNHSRWPVLHTERHSKFMLAPIYSCIHLSQSIIIQIDKFSYCSGAVCMEHR